MKDKKIAVWFEFLLTYGWAIIVVLLFGALLYFGVFDDDINHPSRLDSVYECINWGEITEDNVFEHCNNSCDLHRTIYGGILTINYYDGRVEQHFCTKYIEYKVDSAGSNQAPLFIDVVDCTAECPIAWNFTIDGCDVIECLS